MNRALSEAMNQKANATAAWMGLGVGEVPVPTQAAAETRRRGAMDEMARLDKAREQLRQNLMNLAEVLNPFLSADFPEPQITCDAPRRDDADCQLVKQLAEVCGDLENLASAVNHTARRVQV